MPTLLVSRAIRHDLKTDRMNGYDFDLDAMVSFEETDLTYSMLTLVSIYLAQADYAICRCHIQPKRRWKLKSSNSSKTSHVSSTVHQITLDHLSLLNLSAYLSLQQILCVSWTKAQNVTAVWLFLTQQQVLKKPFAFSVLKLQTKPILKRLRAF